MKNEEFLSQVSPARRTNLRHRRKCKPELGQGCDIVASANRTPDRLATPAQPCSECRTSLRQPRKEEQDTGHGCDKKE